MFNTNFAKPNFDFDQLKVELYPSATEGNWALLCFNSSSTLIADQHRAICCDDLLRVCSTLVKHLVVNLEYVGTQRKNKANFQILL